MAEAPVSDRPNVHSNRAPVAAKYLKYVCFLSFQDSPDKASEETARALDSVPHGSAPGPLNAVIDLFHTGFDGFLPRSKMRWPLDGSAFRVDVPAPKAWLDLLHVVIDRSMFHRTTPADGNTENSMIRARSSVRRRTLNQFIAGGGDLRRI
jgi:hypothetical protein